MSPEEQRIAIAQWCGWNHNVSSVAWTSPTGETSTKLVLPDYLNDLNAMHEVEHKLFPIHVWDHSNPDLWCQYTSILDMICIGTEGGVYRATASQRAEALLKTINKWKDTP